MQVKTKSSMANLACVAGGSGYPRELRSRKRVQKAANVARRMGRSLVEFCSRLRPALAKIPSREKPARELAARHKKFRTRTHSRQLRRLWITIFKICSLLLLTISACINVKLFISVDQYPTQHYYVDRHMLDSSTEAVSRNFISKAISWLCEPLF